MCIRDRVKDILNGIFAAGYEAAAISAGIELKKKSIEFYSERSNVAKNSGERELFKILANWEKTHLKILNDLDKELRKIIWYDNKFWLVI